MLSDATLKMVPIVVQAVLLPLQTDSPVSQAVNRRSGDAPPVTNPLARQRTAPVSVPGSLPDSSHLQVTS